MAKRCIWCNQKAENLKETKIAVSAGAALMPRKQPYFVHPEHEQLFKNYYQRVAKFSRLFWGLVIALSICALGAAFWFSVGAGPILILTGFVILFLPFCLSATVADLGIQTSIRLARVSGFVLMGLGVLLILLHSV